LKPTLSERKGDFQRMAIFAEARAGSRPLQGFPRRPHARPSITPRTYRQPNDLDRERNSGTGEKFANQVIEMMKTCRSLIPVSRMSSGPRYARISAAEAYSSIGLGNLTRKKYDAAAAAFKERGGSQFAPRAGLHGSASPPRCRWQAKNEEAVTWCDKVLAIPDAHPQIKSLATQIKSNATKK
jgi:hypothetical protein